MLEIEHPATGERMRFESPVPQDMQALIGKWRAYSNGPMMTAEEED
jgi:23S rRNA pseudouridine1911/1915/1917 synthase